MTYTTLPYDDFLDMPDHRGQRVERFIYEVRNGRTNEFLGYVKPRRDQAPTLTHNTNQTTKRQLAISLGVRDTAWINPITDRILPYMIVGGTTWPLGRYMFTDDTSIESTAGSLGNFVLFDEGFIVDQQIEHATTSIGAVHDVILGLLEDVPRFIDRFIEPSDFQTTTTFTAGATRGQALDTYAEQGDYFPFWLDNHGVLRMIRTRDPAITPVDLNFDVGRKVIRSTAVRSSDILIAPNKFIVISASGASGELPIIGTYDVPPSAPHSIAQRGFVIPHTQDVQALTPTQATAMARNLGILSTVFERYTLTTVLDPRHDAYNIIHWQGDNWLELAWSMELSPGGRMQHTIRKAYAE